jgi:hypothetical protein
MINCGAVHSSLSTRGSSTCQDSLASETPNHCQDSEQTTGLDINSAGGFCASNKQGRTWVQHPDIRCCLQMFEDYRKIYDFGRTFNPEEYSAKPKTLRDIRVDMREQRDWRNELEKMKISNTVGCLYVDSKSLRNDLIPITTSHLDRVKLQLLNMARENCLQCLEDVKTRVALLQARPQQLDEFMGYQVRHQPIRAKPGIQQ